MYIILGDPIRKSNNLINVVREEKVKQINLLRSSHQRCSAKKGEACNFIKNDSLG